MPFQNSFLMYEQINLFSNDFCIRTEEVYAYLEYYFPFPTIPSVKIEGDVWHVSVCEQSVTSFSKNSYLA